MRGFLIINDTVFILQDIRVRLHYRIASIHDPANIEIRQFELALLFFIYDSRDMRDGSGR